ncbi:MAG: hypothetical protein RBT11_14095 [Desulfobacterales bacterium]|jgi:hypothetical protein|nr:hypothetical protein [Desulfobacterales bacterium]
MSEEIAIDTPQQPIAGELPLDVRLNLQYLADLRDYNLSTGFYATAMSLCRVIDIVFNDWWFSSHQKAVQ